MKRILFVTGLLITLSVSGSALKVIGKIYHLKGIKQQASVSAADASVVSNKAGNHPGKSATCGHYHRKTYE